MVLILIIQHNPRLKPIPLKLHEAGGGGKEQNIHP